MDPDPDSGGPKTCGSGGSGSGTLITASFKRKIYVKISFVSLETLTNYKNSSGRRIIISIPAFLSFIVQFSPLSTPHWMREKSA
jgi:hypothetical protein